MSNFRKRPLSLWLKLLQSFRREDVGYLSTWRKTYKYYMVIFCWAIDMTNFLDFSTLLKHYGIICIIPIVLAFTLVIIPIAYFEMAIGQFSRSTFIKVWKLCPPFKGIGLTYLYLLPIVNLQCNILNVVTLEYLVGSMQSIVPWYNCHGNWVKKNCFVQGETISARTRCYMQHNKTYCDKIAWENSAQHYWNQVIDVDVPIFSLEGHSLSRLQYSLITSVLLYVMLRKGVNSIEFFVPFLAVAPHLLQVVLFITTILLHGTGKATEMFYTLRFNELKNFTMWTESLRQVLAGRNMGLGGTILLGSESGDFRTPIHMATVCVYGLCIFFSLLFGLLSVNLLAVFTYNTNRSSNEVYEHQGNHIYPQASLVFKTWRYPQVWSSFYFSIFYIMMTRTKCLIMHVFLSGIYELFPNLKHYADLCAFVAVVVDFFVSLLYYSKIGLDNYQLRIAIYNNACTIIVMFYETMIISFVYGTRNLIDDIHFMLGFRPSAFWKFCWYLCPLASGVIVFLTFRSWGGEIANVFHNEQTWFLVALVISLVVCAFLPILYMLIYVYRHRKKKKFMAMWKPSSSWGPPDPALRKSREMFSAHSMTKEYMYRQQRLTRQFAVDST